MKSYGGGIDYKIQIDRYYIKAAILVLLIVPCISYANKYTYRFNEPTYNASSGLYTTSMKVAGMFEVSTPFQASEYPQDVASLITDFSFSDGVQTLDFQNSIVNYFSISTNQDGMISSWSFDIEKKPIATTEGDSVSRIIVASSVYLAWFDGLCIEAVDGSCTISGRGSNWGNYEGYELTPDAWEMDDNIAEISISSGYVKLETTGGGIPDATHCSVSSQYGRLVVDEQNAKLYICTKLGWVAK